MRTSGLLSRLVSFWVEPTDARPLRRWRVLVGVVLVTWFVGWFRAMPLLLPDRLAPVRSTDAMISLPSGHIPWVAVTWVAAGTVASALLAFGLWWRPAAVGAAACALSILATHPAARNGGDMLIGTWALLTALAAVFDGGGWGRSAVSTVRRNRHSGSSDPVSSRSTPLAVPWLRRMLLCQLSIVYVASVLHKLGTPDWRSGMAVGYAANFGPWKLPVDPGVLLELPALSRLLTWGTIVVELAIPVLLWIRRWQWWGVGLVLALHLGIELTLDVGYFGIAMMIAALCVPDTTLSVRANPEKNLSPA